MTRLAIGALALLVAACAAPAPKRGWDPDDLRAPEPAPVLAGAPAAGLEPSPDGRPPLPTDYPPPPGGRLLATFEGPAARASPADLVLPAEAIAPFLPPAVAATDLVADGLLDLDVDGDGVAERVILGPLEGGAVLVVLRRDGTPAAGWALLPLTDGARTCHGEWILAGALARGRARLPVVFEERGAGCGAFEGGGFDRRLLVFDPARDAPAEALLARARLGAGGAADVHQAVAHAGDLDGDGAEELWVRGVSAGIRPCGRAGDPPYWVEEGAWRVIGPGRTVAVRGREVTPLADGVLPASLLVSHPAACGAARR